jgi:hypothetical protein
MLYLDYLWDLNPNGLIIDPELNTDRLGWKDGDIFRFSKHEGFKSLTRVECLEKFLLTGIINKTKGNNEA